MNNTKKSLELKDNYKLYIFLLVSGFLVVFGRTAHAVINPVMYTEDGLWTSSLIYDGFVKTCLTAKGSYLILGNILILEVALKINTWLFGHNLLNLATILAILSYLYYDLMAFLPVFLLRKQLSMGSRIFLFFGVLLIPMGKAISEMYGRGSNIGYGVFYIAFVLMLWFFVGEHAIWKKFIMHLMLVLCCSTNPVCYVIFAIVWVVEMFKVIRNKKIREIPALILPSVVALGSIIVMYFYKIEDLGQASEKINWTQVIEYFFRSWMFNFVWPFYGKMNDIKAVILLVMFLLLMALMLWLARKNNTYLTLMILSYGALIGYTIVTLVSRKSLTWQLDRYSTTWPDRYFYVQNILVLFVLAVFISTVGANILISSKLVSIATKAVAFLCIYFFVLQGLLAEEIFEGTKSKCVEVSATLGDRINKAYTEQGDVEDYIVLCPFADSWPMKIPRKYVVASVEAYREKQQFAL